MHTAAVAINAALDVDLGNTAQSKQPQRASRKATKLITPVVPPVLPSLAASKHFLNLTNGLEAVPLLESLHLPYGLVEQLNICTLHSNHTNNKRFV